MRSRVSLFTLLLLMTTTILVYGQGEKKPRAAEDYAPRTLRELSTLYPPIITRELKKRTDQELRDMGVITHSDLLPSRVKVVYEGTLRPINESKKKVITSWGNRPDGVSEFDAIPYQTEMLFTENGENYWLAVRQDALLKFHELKRGETVVLFVIKMGSIRIERTDEEMEPILLVEKFMKP